MRLLRIAVVVLELLGVVVSASGAEVDGIEVSRRLASVRVIVPSGGGWRNEASGTIFYVGDYGGTECGYGLTIWHAGCPDDGLFWVDFVDGHRAQARKVGIDSETDQMLFVVRANTILGVAPLSDVELERSATLVGFPDGVGPKEREVSLVGPLTIMGVEDGRFYDRMEWRISGPEPYWKGYSGSGIFNEDRLVGVLSHAEGSDLSASTPRQMSAFLRRRDKLFNRGGDKCRDGNCTPGGPRDTSWLQPNVEIAIPKRPNRDPEKAESPLRLDINRDREQKKAIAELQALVKQLVEKDKEQDALIAELEGSRCQCAEHEMLPIPPEGDAPPAPEPPDVGGLGEEVRELAAGQKGLTEWMSKANLRILSLERSGATAGERGPPGPPGPRGEDGEPGPEREVDVVLKWEDGTAIGSATIPPGKTRVIQYLRKSLITAERMAAH